MAAATIWLIGWAIVSEWMPEKKWPLFNWPWYIGQYLRNEK